MLTPNISPGSDSESEDRPEDYIILRYLSSSEFLRVGANEIEYHELGIAEGDEEFLNQVAQFRPFVGIIYVGQDSFKLTLLVQQSRSSPKLPATQLLRGKEAGLQVALFCCIIPCTKANALVFRVCGKFLQCTKLLQCQYWSRNCVMKGSPLK